MTAHTVLISLFRPALGAKLFRRLRLVPGVLRSRRALSRLDDRMLRDIGVTREEAQAEFDRSLWDVPSHWRG